MLSTMQTIVAARAAGDAALAVDRATPPAEADVAEPTLIAAAAFGRAHAAIAPPSGAATPLDELAPRAGASRPTTPAALGCAGYPPCPAAPPPRPPRALARPAPVAAGASSPGFFAAASAAAASAADPRRTPGATPASSPALEAASSPGASPGATEAWSAPAGPAGPLNPALERVRLGPGGWRRPGLARLGSTASAVIQVVPEAPLAIFDEVTAAMAQALRLARAKGGLGPVQRKFGAARLHGVARKLAGPEAVGLSLAQTRAVVEALARPHAVAGSAAQLQAEQAVLTGGPSEQPTVKPLLWFSDELFRQAYRACDVTLRVERDEVLVLQLRRTAAALSATSAALQSYQHYVHTPGYRHLGDYRRQLAEQLRSVEERQGSLLQKEWGCHDG